MNPESQIAKQHHLIYIPGLNDRYQKQISYVPQLFWRAQGFYTHVVFPDWEKGDKFAPKLEPVLEQIDKLVSLGRTVSLIGQSAGGSTALIAFCERRNVVNGVINATGRMKSGENVNPTLEQAARHSPAFKEAVLLLEQEYESSLTGGDRKKIMTIRPRWDRVVPSSTVSIEGATNLVAPVIDHSIGGFAIVTAYSKVWLNFLRDLEKH